MPKLMSLCPLCGSERLIPLTFPQDEFIGVEVEDRPVAKCSICGHRIYDADVLIPERPYEPQDSN